MRFNILEIEKSLKRNSLLILALMLVLMDKQAGFLLLFIDDENHVLIIQNSIQLAVYYIFGYKAVNRIASNSR